jgi:hypothetical protein
MDSVSKIPCGALVRPNAAGARRQPQQTSELITGELADYARFFINYDWACFLAGSANTERGVHSNAHRRQAAIMAQRKKRPTARKGKSIARRKARKPSKSARKGPAKRTVARATPRKRSAQAKLKRGAKKARKKVRAVKPPTTPVVETVVVDVIEEPLRCNGRHRIRGDRGARGECCLRAAGRESFRTPRIRRTITIASSARRGR